MAAESSSSGSTGSSSSSSRRGLHLVVMGHVDAGKSTLMGRLLHELGQVSQKEVHKNQKEAAQAGKVSGHHLVTASILCWPVLTGHCSLLSG
jgi:elongation factor 1 alpha-like protein